MPLLRRLFRLYARERLGDALVIVFRRRAGDTGAADELAVDGHGRAAGTAPEFIGIKSRHADDEVITRIAGVALHSLSRVALVGDGGFCLGDRDFLAEAAARLAHARVGDELSHLVDDGDKHLELHLARLLLDSTDAFLGEIQCHGGHSYSPRLLAGFSASPIQTRWPLSGTS